MPGPKLPNLNKGGKTTKGSIKGVRDGSRNDLSKPYTGLTKASNKKTINEVNV